MLKKQITYTDFNDETQTEVHYFHLSSADLVELEMSQKGGMSTWLQKIIDSNDGATIMAEFKKLIMLSYGKKSEDGKRFIKSQALIDEFLSSAAFSELFVELCTDAEAAAQFANGILPKDLGRLQAAQNDPERPNLRTTDDEIANPEAHGATVTSLEKTQRIISRAEAIDMTNEELTKAVAEGAVIKSI